MAENVDVVEPIAKFTAKLQDVSGVRSVFNVGLEDWKPSDPTIRYDLIWNQWCVGHLTDAQLVQYLVTCREVLNPNGGVIVVKENLSTTDEDAYDTIDSSVTR